MRRALLLLGFLYPLVMLQAQAPGTIKKTKGIQAGKQLALTDEATFNMLLTTKQDIAGKKSDPGVFKGQLVLLNFYDLEMDRKAKRVDCRDLLAIQSKLEGVKVIRITKLEGNFAEAAPAFKNQLSADALKMIHFLDNENEAKLAALKAYNVTSLPVTFLLDGTGKILNTFHGPVSDSIMHIYQIVDKKRMSEAELAGQAHIATWRAWRQQYQSLAGSKEKESFLAGIDRQHPYFLSFSSNMKAALVADYASRDDVSAAQRMLSEIEDRQLQLEAVYSLAQILSAKGQVKESLQLLTSHMDSIQAEAGVPGKISLNSVYAYAKLAELLGNLMPVAGNEARIIQYLGPVFNTCRFFPLDPHTADGEKIPAIDSLLSLKYALALAATGQEKESVKVLSAYLDADLSGTDLLAELAKKFSPFSNLFAQLPASNSNGNERNRQNLFKLFLKKELGGKVTGFSSVKAQYILIDFWGSWCGPCRASHPFLKELYRKYKNKGLEIVGIATEFANEDPQKYFVWKRAVEKDGIPWIHFLNQENIRYFDAFKEFEYANNARLVQKLILDRDGNFIGLFNGKDKEGLSKKLAELMPDSQN